jgi:hypothetical protein
MNVIRSGARAASATLVSPARGCAIGTTLPLAAHTPAASDATSAAAHASKRRPGNPLGQLPITCSLLQR